jgi:hypothetical protein
MVETNFRSSHNSHDTQHQAKEQETGSSTDKTRERARKSPAGITVNLGGMKAAQILAMPPQKQAGCTVVLIMVSNKT